MPLCVPELDPVQCGLRGHITRRWGGSVNMLPSLGSAVTVFLSILLEAFPFIIIGVLISTAIGQYVSEDAIRRLLPRNRVARLVTAALLGLVMPMCECGIIPIVRRLVSKKVPMSACITFMLATPIINPISAAATFMAFPLNPHMAVLRLLWGFVVAFLVGFIWSVLFERDGSGDGILFLRDGGAHGHGCSCNHEHGAESSPRFSDFLVHAGEEFTDVARYVVLGAAIASLTQAMIPRSLMASVGSNHVLSIAVMMLFAFVLSLCSEADAFVASTFQSTFTPGSLLAFMVFGPMLDIKNTMMLFSSFRPRVVLRLMAIVTVVVFSLSVLYGGTVPPLTR